MGITFDHVEGVVQKAAEPGAATPSPAPGGASGTKSSETPEAAERRRERLARRLHAD